MQSDMMPSNVDVGDDHLFVQFYMGSVENKEKSLAEGHPIFEPVPFVKIMVPGDKNTMIDTSVTPQYKRRFQRLWNLFEQNQTQTMEGFPIRDWPAITRAQADELFHLNIITVEHLAGIADVYGTRIMGFNDLKRKAQAYLAQAKDSAFAEKVSAENASLKVEIDALREQIAVINRRFEEATRAKSELVST